MQHYVYKLIDPRDGKPFYIGLTSLDPHVRLYHHTLDATDSPKTRRINDIRQAGLKTVVEVIEQVEDKATAFAREKHWIRQYRQTGHVLTNGLKCRRTIRPAREREPVDFTKQMLVYTEVKGKMVGRLVDR